MIFAVEALIMELMKRDDIQDVAAALQSELNDLVMVGGDIDMTCRRRREVEASEHVGRLEKLGVLTAERFRRDLTSTSSRAFTA